MRRVGYRLSVVACLRALVLLAASLLALEPAGALARSGVDSPHAVPPGGVTIAPILHGYSRPVAVVTPPGVNRRIYIVEQTGRIRIASYRKGHWQKSKQVFLDLHGKVSDPSRSRHQEAGLVGLAFAPDFASSHRFYVTYTQDRPGDLASRRFVLAGYRAKDAHHAATSSARTVLSLPLQEMIHHGGTIAFGPDGHLYLGVGDGGPQGDPSGHAQDLDSLMGKILRIDPLDPDGAGPRTYSIPADNPYVGVSPGRDEVWAYGFRNPWRWSFDRGTGDLWIGDVGNCRYEEIDHVKASGGHDAGKGLGFGWNLLEGTYLYPQGPSDPCGPTAECMLDCQTLPVFEMDHLDGACAIIGGYVYRGQQYASWDGYYVAGDLCDVLTVLDQAGHVVVQAPSTLAISGFGENAGGGIFVTAVDGTIGRVVFLGTPAS